MTDRPEPSKILSLPRGTMIDDYEIVELIGKGGMGAVFLATDTRRTIHFPVALKILYPHLARKSGDFTRRFLRESRIASRISHPNLVQVYECNFCDEQELYFIAQEYIGGGSLRQLVATDTVLAESDALRVGIGIARALDAAFQHKVVHRDIKPDNIMFALDGTVKLTDWGIAKNTVRTNLGTGANLELTVNKVFMGTPLYASPEQLQNTRNVDSRADIYSLGATMYYSLVGKPPLKGTTEIESLCVILTKAAPDVRKARPDVSVKTAVLLKRMLEKDPAARPQTPAILLEALLAVAGDFNLKNIGQAVEATVATEMTRFAGKNKVPVTPRQLPASVSQARQAPVEAKVEEAAPPSAAPSSELAGKSYPLERGGTLHTQQTYSSPPPPKKQEQAENIPSLSAEKPPSPDILPKPTSHNRHDSADELSPDLPKAPVKSSLGFFWKLVLIFFLLGGALSGGWVAYREYQYRSLLEQGDEALHAKHFAEACDIFQRARTVKPLDLRAFEGVNKASVGRQYEKLISEAKQLQALQPPNWQEILRKYETALRIEGFTEDEVALEGVQKARNGQEYSELLTQIAAAIQEKDWIGARERLDKAGKIPGFASNSELKPLNLQVDNEIQYFTLVEKGLKELKNSADWAFPERLFREALLLEKSDDYRKAAEGLAEVWKRKADQEIKNKDFAAARKTLAGVTAAPEKTDVILNRLQTSLSPGTLKKIAELSQQISQLEKADKEQKVQQQYDLEMKKGNIAQQSADYDKAIAAFQSAAKTGSSQEQSAKAFNAAQNALSLKIRQLIKDASAALAAKPESILRAEDFLSKAGKALPGLSEETSRTDLMAQMSAIKTRMKDIKLRQLYQDYEGKLTLLNAYLKKADGKDIIAVQRFESMEKAANCLVMLISSYAEAQQIDQSSVRKEHLTAKAKLLQQLSELGQSQLELSQKEKNFRKSFEPCALAEKCYQQMLRLLAGAQDLEAQQQVEQALGKVSNEKKFLELLEDSDHHLQNNDFAKAEDCLQQAAKLAGHQQDSRSSQALAGIREVYFCKLLGENKRHLENNDFAKAEDCLQRATKLPGYQQDPRIKQALEEIRKIKANTSFSAALQKAREHENQRQWQEAENAYRKALKMPGFDTNENAMNGLARAQKGTQFDLLCEKAKQAALDKHWQLAEKFLLEALTLNVEKKETERTLQEIRKAWHDELCSRAAEALKKDQWTEMEKLRREANTIPGYENNNAICQQWITVIASRAKTALEEKNWREMEILGKLLKQVPGFETKVTEIRQNWHHALCAEGDELLQAGDLQKAQQFFLAASTAGYADPANRAQMAIQQCERGTAAEQKFSSAMDELRSETVSCQQKIYLLHRDAYTDFLCCLRTCYELMMDMPQNSAKEKKHRELTQLLTDEFLPQMADHLLNHVKVLALPEENQSEGKCVFLAVLSECEQIAPGSISKLTEKHPLRMNVSKFFQQNFSQTLLSDAKIDAIIITWLRPLLTTYQEQ